MKQKLYVLAVAIVVSLLACPALRAASSGTCGAKVTWTLDDAGNLVIEGSGAMDDISSKKPWGTQIKTVMIAEGVTRIGEYAFADCPVLTRVTIPSSMLSIGINAFNNCNALTRVDISDLSAWCNIKFDFGSMGKSYSSNPLTVAQHLYINDTEVTDLIIPEGVTSISPYAFYQCNMITSVTIPASIDSIGDKAFFNCRNITRTNISDLSAWCRINFESESSNPLNTSYRLFVNGEEVKELVIPEDITTIKKYAFYNCGNIRNKGLVSITISNSVTSIEPYAFTYSNVKIVKMGNSIKSIGQRAFGNCAFTSLIELPSSVTKIGLNAFDKATNTVIKVDATTPPTLLGALPMTVALVPDASVSAYKAAEYWKDMTIISQEKTDVEITMTDGVTLAEAIVRQARIAPASVTKLKVHGSLTSDDLETIKTMTNCYSIDLSDTDVETIPDEMFSGRTTLVYMALPKNLKKIGSKAFYECVNLEISKFPNTLETILDYAFRSCSPIAEIELPESLKTLGTKGMNFTEGSVFSGCSSLKRVVLPKGLTFFGPSTFSGCSLLKSIDMSQLSITVIPVQAFQGCYYLKDVKLSSTIEKIGQSAFADCTGLRNIDLPSSVKEIIRSAFSGCTSLNVLNLSKSLTKIGEGAFKECTSVNVINCPAPVPPTMDTDVFADVNKEKCVLTIPNDKYFEYFVAPYWGQFLENTSGVLVNILDTNGSVKYGVSGGNATIAPIRAMSVQTTNNDDDITAEAFNNANICVKGNMSLTFKITPDEGYQIETVKYAGKDVTSQVVDGIFTTPAITGDTQIDVSFKEKLGVEDVATSDLKVWANGMSIYVQTTDRATVNVTSLSGVTRTYVAEAGVTEIAMSAPGIYIVNGKKVVVR